MAEHRHVFTVHRHPEWLGHSVEGLPGYKPADHWHTHFWWRHDHGTVRGERMRMWAWNLAFALLALAFVVVATGSLVLFEVGLATFGLLALWAIR